MTDTSTHPDAADAAATGLAAVVYNPVKVDLDALKTAVAAEEKTGAWGTTLWFETTEDDPGQGPTKQALGAGATMVIVAGGDGTVRAVAEALFESEASLAVLPSGTGNLLARNLGLALNDLEGSLHTAFTGHDRRIDLGVIEIKGDDTSTTRHVFLIMAGLGLDAKMLARTDDELKKKIGWLAYVGALLTAMRDTNQLHLHCSIDGAPAESIRAHTVIIGNCGTLPADIILLPDATIDDGDFEIVILRPTGFFGWVQITAKVVWENGILRRTETGRKLMGRTKGIRALRYVKGREVVISLTRPHDIELDGDSFGQAQHFTTRVEPGALTVRV